ncbi:MAG TPA: alpha/beta hydrolase, partial [Myxococcota bacterium]|nr:alpha/beta hydrolase [Myxococcota bacterium]
MRLLEPSRIGHIVLLDITPNVLRGDVGGLDRVLEHVLAAPAQVGSREEMRTLFLGHGISPALTDWVLLNLTQDGDVLRWRFDRDKLKALHLESCRQDFWPAVEAPGVKTTLIYGKRSKFVADIDVDRFDAAGADVIAIPDAGHFLHVDAQAQLLDELVALGL